MKKILFTLLLLTPFIFFLDEVDALNWENYNWAAIKPTYTTFFDDTNGYQSGATQEFSAWGFPGYGLFKNYSFLGSFDAIPSHVSWRYDNVQWCKGYSWILKGQIFSTTEVANNFFYDKGIELHVITDYGESACSTTPISANTTGYNGIEFECAGSTTNSWQFVMYFNELPYLTTNFMIRNNVSDIACDVTSTDLYNSLEQAEQSIINNQNNNSQNIINNQNQNSQNEITNANNNQAQTNERLDNLNENITNDNIDSSSAGGFFGNYKDNDYGLSSVITAPLEFIQNLNSNTCTDLTLPIPFVNQNATLPCMTNIYNKHFGSVFTLYQTITTGFIAYWVAVRIFALVKGFKDPEDDKIEVMDL